MNFNFFNKRGNGIKFITVIVMAAFFSGIILAISSVSLSEDFPGENSLPKDPVIPTIAAVLTIATTPTVTTIPKETFNEIFGVYKIDEETAKRMMNKSYKVNKDIQLSDLRLIRMSYHGFDNLPHVGELIVNKRIAAETMQIFKELYKAKFKIEKIELIDNYDADDDKSMEANNTSGFNYRPVTGGTALSKHGMGMAIDINPVQNPYINGKEVLPEKGRDYLDRENLRMGMITKAGACYRIFKKYGWTWGGNWKIPIDYQHFEKRI